MGDAPWVGGWDAQPGAAPGRRRWMLKTGLPPSRGPGGYEEGSERGCSSGSAGLASRRGRSGSWMTSRNS